MAGDARPFYTICNGALVSFPEKPIKRKRACMDIAIRLALFVFFIELIYYIFLIPDLLQRPLKVNSLDSYFGRIVYIAAYMLSLLRAPLGLLPYLVKMFIFFVLRV